MAAQSQALQNPHQSWEASSDGDGVFKKKLFIISTSYIRFLLAYILIFT